MFRWTSWTAPDPDDTQIVVMIAAVKTVAAAYGWPLDKIWVWVEYALAGD